MEVLYSFKSRWKECSAVQQAWNAQEHIAMAWLVKPLLFFLASCTRNQLIR